MTKRCPGLQRHCGTLKLSKCASIAAASHALARREEEAKLASARLRQLDPLLLIGFSRAGNPAI
jgi:hypothetical protein